MRIWSVACLMACLVLPVGAEPPSPEITPEEAKAIAKEAVREILDDLENRPDQAGKAEECRFYAQLGNNPDLYPEHFAQRTDHLKPCPGIWTLLGGGKVFAKEQFMLVTGYPQGKLRLKCHRGYQGEERIRASLEFKDHWHHDFPYSTTDAWSTRVRRKEDRVHLQLGFSSKVGVAGDGEGFTLKQTTLDYEWLHSSWPKPLSLSTYIGAGKLRKIREHKHETAFFGEEAAALMRSIFHSEAFSWTDRKIGETNTVLVGETIRPSLDKLFDFCGMDPDGPLLLPRDSLSSAIQSRER